MRKIGEVYYQSSDWQQLMWQEVEKVVRRSHAINAKLKLALDLGCGSGSRTSQLRGLFPSLQKVVAIDNNPAMLATAREKVKAPGIEFRQLDMMEVEKLPESNFDVVMSHCALHWLGDKNGFFEQLSKKVAPGAYLVFATSEQTPEILALIDERIRAYFKVTSQSPMHFISFAQWEPILLRHKWKVVAQEVKTMFHRTESGMPYLRHWYSASAGAAFYGQEVEKLPTEFVDSLIEELAKKFPGPLKENLEFPEKTLYVVAQYGSAG